MKYVVSVSKTYLHRGNHRHKSDTKKRWFIYYYEDGFKTKQVSWIQAMYYKTQKYKRIKYVCIECGSLFLGFVKTPKEVLDCPYCEQ